MTGEVSTLDRMAQALAKQNRLAQQDLELRRLELKQARDTERACMEQAQAEKSRRAIEEEHAELTALLYEEEKTRNSKLDILILQIKEMVRWLTGFQKSEPRRQAEITERIDAVLLGLQLMFTAFVREWGDTKHYEDAMAAINKFAGRGQTVEVQSGGARFGDVDEVSGQVAGRDAERKEKGG